MKSIRSLLFWLHLIAGFAAAAIIFLLSLSGVARAYERQLSEWGNPAKIVRPSTAPTSPLPVDALLAAATKAHPGTPGQIQIRRDLSQPVEIRYGRQGGLQLNPWTAEVLPRLPNRIRPTLDVFSRIHHALGGEMRNPLGRAFTDAANFIFLYLILSGVYLWLPKTWNAANFKFRLLFKPRLKGRVRDWNWHHVLGVWTFLPLFFIALTGVLFSYNWANRLLFAVTGSPQIVMQVRPGWQPDPVLTVSTGAPLSAGEAAMSLEQVTSVARAAYPDWQSLQLDLPQPQDRTVGVTVSQSLSNQPFKTVRLRIGRASGQIAATHRFSDYSRGLQLRMMARGIHTGEIFGVVGQTIAALASIAAMILSWTGMALTLRRMRQALPKMKMAE